MKNCSSRANAAIRVNRVSQARAKQCVVIQKIGQWGRTLLLERGLRLVGAKATFREDDLSGLGQGLLLYTCLETAQDCLGMILINLPLFNAIMILPLPLLLIAWFESNRKPIEFSILTLSAILLNAAGIRSVKLALLGTDYSSRLDATIAVNMLLAIVLGIHLGIKRRWIAMAAALILAFAWLLLAAVNAAV